MLRTRRVLQCQTPASYLSWTISFGQFQFFLNLPQRWSIFQLQQAAQEVTMSLCQLACLLLCQFFKLFFKPSLTLSLFKTNMPFSMQIYFLTKVKEVNTHFICLLVWQISVQQKYAILEDDQAQHFGPQSCLYIFQFSSFLN